MRDGRSPAANLSGDLLGSERHQFDTEGHEVDARAGDPPSRAQNRHLGGREDVDRIGSPECGLVHPAGEGREAGAWLGIPNDVRERGGPLPSAAVHEQSGDR
jgi:hypothetical protein